MDKVTSYNYHPAMASMATTSTSQSTANTHQAALPDRSPEVRGHHSGINKAVEAHRMMVEERQMRKQRREVDTNATAQPNAELYVAQQVQQNGAGSDVDYGVYDNQLIEPASSQAKMASVQSFQSIEPDRPIMGEPIPKGSYLDVEV